MLFRQPTQKILDINIILQCRQLGISDTDGIDRGSYLIAESPLITVMRNSDFSIWCLDTTVKGQRGWFNIDALWKADNH